MIISFSKEIYPKSVLLKAAFTFTDRAYIHLDAENDRYIVKIVPKNNDTEISDREFVNEMLCQAVRFEVYKNTKHIRELLLAKSLSSTLIELPQTCTENDVEQNDFDMNGILTDWFESNET